MNNLFIQIMQPIKINILEDSGKGRCFCILIEQNFNDFSTIHKIAEFLSGTSRVVTLELQTIRSTNWQQISLSIQEKLKELKIRQTSLIAFHSSCSIAQNLCLQNLKFVRTLVLINPTTRSHPNFLSKLIENIERHLPLGLPLRQNTNDFDSKPFLQRMRVPTLLITTEQATAYVQSEVDFMLKRLPTAWHLELEAKNIPEKILNFEAVPAKCPQ